ncbi:MAG: STAS domain-containing protein [Acidimicrobiales bacterium]
MAIEVLEERPLGEEPGLTVEFRHIGPICIISLYGVLHAASVAVLEEQVDRLGRTSCSRVVVDMSEVRSMDATGARVLSGLRHYVDARGGHFSVIGMDQSVRAVLAVDKVDEQSRESFPASDAPASWGGAGRRDDAPRDDAPRDDAPTG